MTWAFILDSVPFTKAVRDGETSLGGSESACLGLARALAKRGHDVNIFATQLSQDATGRDAAGCIWHPVETFHTMNTFIEWDVVVALRWFAFFGIQPVFARLRLLWNQDLLVPGGMVNGMMSVAWAVDKFVYVSDYHRRQWEDLEPSVAGHGWATRNGFDPSHLPTSSTKNPNRIIHISRPERGLKPLLQMWPKLREQKPDATLQICRYSSMYDEGGWGEVCKSFDRAVERVNEQVGGIEYLGELNKPQLYKAISDASVMWYPGVATFAETSCCAAVEAQACGTPFVGSLKGALPETARPSFDAGLLIRGDAEKDAAYQQDSITAVLTMMDWCARQTFSYRQLVKAGQRYVEDYTFDAIAAEWEEFVEQTFKARYEANKIRVMQQLLHEDDHVAALQVTEDIREDAGCGIQTPDTREAARVADFCDYVIAGKDQTAEQYGNAAIADPLREIEFSGRFKACWPMFDGCTHVLDVACGNGSFAIGLAQHNPNVRVYGLDYSQANIDRATEAAVRAGVSDRCTFDRVTVYDFDTQQLHHEWHGFVKGFPFDGLFVGEFVEHVANCTGLVDGIEKVLTDGAKVVYTCPRGNCAELVPRHMPLSRGHVHNFHHDDVKAVWGAKQDFRANYFAGGFTERGNPIGNWIISYTVAPSRPAGARPLSARIERTRPMQKLSVGMIVKDAELDLAKCLTSIWPVCDELVIGDTGSTDKTVQIAKEFNAKVLTLDHLDQQPEGFAGARNQVLAACTGDWFMWIDADEQLIDGFWLRRYLDGPVFHGYVLHQTHLYIDGEPTHDVPVRVFRTNKNIRFYGCVHEQPQMGGCNEDIHPTLEPLDVKIAHVGYLTERTRSSKRIERNLPLLHKDRKVFADRTLGHVLWIREFVIQGDESRADAGGAMTGVAHDNYMRAVALFAQNFDDPRHKYHKLGRPWYEAALRHLGIGYEFEFALAGRAGGMEHRRAGAERFWVRDADEAERIIQWKVETVKQGMAKSVFKTDPFVLPAREQVPA